MHSIGEILQNRYQIMKLESEGGMSHIYKVEDRRLQKQWALKELKSDTPIPDDSPEYRQFRTEARILADFSHPAFPRVIDFFVDGGKAYLVEEWIEGETLEKFARGGIPGDKIKEFVLQILDALEYIHKKGIIYRDLKPQNVMITAERRIKLIDFGIARFYKAGKRKDTLFVGTPGYAPPEQFGIGQTDMRTDIYSLGACIYFMITGAHPPEENFNMEVPPEYAGPTSPELSGAVRKAMRAKPEERFQSVDELRGFLSAQEKKGASHEKAGILTAIILLLLMTLFMAEIRVPVFYGVILFLLIYGFVWSLGELRKRRGKG